jgi:cell division septation protein DedD
VFFSSTIETKQSETKIVKEKNTENTNINQNTPSISEEKFAIIAGCFSSIENAEKYVNELKSKGYPAKVFGTTKTGLHRVAISTFNNETEALENLSQLRLTFAGNTWLLNN